MLAAGLPLDHLVALCFTKKKIHYKNDVLLFDAFKEKPKKNYQNRELVSLSRTCNIPTM